MVIEFEKEYLRELFIVGKTSTKKHRFQSGVIKKYIKTVNILKSAPDTEFLYKFNSLHYEKKSGDLKDIEAVWINDQYRLLFKCRTEGENPNIIVICSLVELSKHYE